MCLRVFVHVPALTEMCLRNVSSSAGGKVRAPVRTQCIYIYAYYIQIFCWNSQIPSDGIYTIYTNPVVYTYSRRWQKKVRRVQLKLFAGLRIHVLSCLKSSGSYLWTSFLTIKRINASHPWEWFKVRDFRKTNCHVNWWDLSCQPKQSVNFTLLLLALKRCCWWKNSCSPPGMYKTL